MNVPIDDIYACLNRRHFSDGRKPFLGDQDFNGYKAVNLLGGTAPGDAVTYGQLQALMSSIGVVPTGALMPLTGNQVPAGYLVANGQYVFRASYPALWAFAQASGNLAASQGAKGPGQFGPGDGASTFTLPDLTANGGEFIRSLTSGRPIGSAQTDDVEAHNHTATFTGQSVPDHEHSFTYRRAQGGGSYVSALNRATDTSDIQGINIGSQVGVGPAGAHTPAGTVTVQNNAGTETRPHNIGYPYLIKT